MTELSTAKRMSGKPPLTQDVRGTRCLQQKRGKKERVANQSGEPPSGMKSRHCTLQETSGPKRGTSGLTDAVSEVLPLPSKANPSKRKHSKGGGGRFTAANQMRTCIGQRVKENGSSSSSSSSLSASIVAHHFVIIVIVHRRRRHHRCIGKRCYDGDIGATVLREGGRHGKKKDQTECGRVMQ